MMKAILKFLILFLLLCCFMVGKAQLVQRNLFTPFTAEYIRQVLPAPGKWHPFPTTADGWHLLLPDSVIKQYIANGDSALRQDFPALSAVSFLQFSRSKSRSQYESLHFAALPNMYGC